MPATRRNSSTVPSPRKSRASRREEQPRVDTETSRGTRRQASVSPENTDTSDEKNIDNSQDVETRAEGTAGGSSSPTTNDGVSRRSGRQRIVSKRLQDMELNFGTRKTPIKREHEADRDDGTPKKKTRQGLSSKSPTKVPKKQDSGTGNTEDVIPPAVASIPSTTLAKTPTPSPVSTCGILPSGNQDEVVPKSPEQDPPCQGDEGEAVEVTGGDIEPHSDAILSSVDNRKDTENTPSLAVSVSETPVSVSETPENIPVTVEHENLKQSLLECDSAVLEHTFSDNQGSHSSSKGEECPAESTVKQTKNVGGEQSKNTTKESPVTTELTHAPPSQEIANQRPSFSENLTTSPSGHPIVIAPIDLPNEDSTNESSESTSDLTATQAILASTHEVLASTQAVLDPSHAILSNTNDLGSVPKEDDSHVPANTDDIEGEDGQSSDEAAGSSVPNGEKVETSAAVNPASETPAQFIVLDDGRQLLLSDADALATAADAVASLSQMKDVAFIVSQTGSETAPLVAVASDKQEQPAFSQIQQSLSQKIKFVTVNAQSLPAEGESQPESYQCHLDMVITNQGQVSAGPATVLSADGFYRCSMCAYKTDKKGNWYKHRYTHMAHRKYNCDRCDHKATTASNLKRHMLIHTDMKVFQCEICCADFRQKIHLDRHIRYRHEKKTVKCKYCDYVCSNVNPDLKVHMKRRHVLQTGGDKFQFRCETCGFIAASSRDLKQHQKFHRAGPELKLYCEQCSFVTDCESRLRRHLLTHTKERPFWCSICNYRASQKEHVIRHLRNKHQVTSCHVVEARADEDGIVPTVIQPDQSEEQEDPSMEGQSPVAGQTTISTVTSGSSVGGEGGDKTRSVLISFDQQSTAEPTQGQHWKRVMVNIPGKGPEEFLVQATQEDEQEDEQQLASESQELQEGEGQPEEEETPHPQTTHTNDPSPAQTQSDQSPSTLTERPASEVNTQQNIPVDRPVPSSSSPSEADVQSRTGRESMIIYAPTRKAATRKKYEPADFSSREKVFSCIHCTMKFAKLINLYKHLSVQHKDSQATKDDGLHTCVWCEYQTNKWKNLLVHMRKHNYREEYGTVPTRYACVVCTYSSQQRKALYAHMMKKHKIQIYVKPDGSASCIIDDTVPSTMSSTDGKVVMLQRPRSEVGRAEGGQTMTHGHHQQSAGGAASSFTEEETQGVQQQQQTQSEQGSHPNTQMVMIELEPGMPATAVEILAPNRSEDVDHEAADAIEGLQALAEQVMAAQQEEEHQAEEGGQEAQFAKGEEQGEGQEQEEEEEQATEETSQAVTEGEEEQTQIHIQDLSGQVVEGSNIQLTPEQLMQLTSGDYIEINGEMYKVEVAEEGYTP